jgi:hypothetical protein
MFVGMPVEAEVAAPEESASRSDGAGIIH